MNGDYCTAMPGAYVAHANSDCRKTSINDHVRDICRKKFAPFHIQSEDGNRDQRSAVARGKFSCWIAGERFGQVMPAVRRGGYG